MTGGGEGEGEKWNDYGYAQGHLKVKESKQQIEQIVQLGGTVRSFALVGERLKKDDI